MKTSCGKFLNLAHYFPYEVKLRLLAHSRSFLANQKARNAIVGAENLLNVCIQLPRFAMFRSCCQQVHCQSRTDWALKFCNFCIEFCKKPSRKTFLMQVFAGLCTGKSHVKLLMLQNNQTKRPENRCKRSASD